MKKNAITDTAYIHRRHIAPGKGNYPLESPIYHSVKYTFDDLEHMENMFGQDNDEYFIYSRIASPTVRELEVLLAQVMGEEDALCSASGMGSITALTLGLLEKGDSIAIPLHSYGTSRSYAKKVLSKFGIESVFLSWPDLANLAAIKQKNPNLKMLLIESITNPMVRVPDLQQIIGECQKIGIIAAVDATFASLSPAKLASPDLYVVSLTKYACGHGDTLGGAVMGNKKLIAQIRATQLLLGPSLDPYSAQLILRGLETYPLRRARMVDSAQKIALFLEGKPQIKTLWYPGLPSHPECQIAREQLWEPGAMLAMTLKKNNRSQIQAFIKKLKLFKLTASLGSTKSLIAPVEVFYTRDLNAAEKSACDIEPGTMRISVGLEDTDDLIADLKGALEIL